MKKDLFLAGIILCSFTVVFVLGFASYRKGILTGHTPSCTHHNSESISTIPPIAAKKEVTNFSHISNTQAISTNFDILDIQELNTSNASSMRYLCVELVRGGQICPMINDCKFRKLYVGPASRLQWKHSLNSDNKISLRFRVRIPAKSSQELFAPDIRSKEFQYHVNMNIKRGVYFGFEWKSHTFTDHWNPRATALVIVDMWDNHLCLSTAARVNALAPVINKIANKLRCAGVTIIHAISGVPDLERKYPKTYPWVRRLEKVALYRKRIPTRKVQRPESPLAQWPDCDGFEDTTLPPLTRGNKRLNISDEDAVMSGDDFEPFMNLLSHRSIENILYAGVHTNRCMMNRPLGLKKMIQHEFKISILRDATDTMYHPAASPFLDTHEEGTQLFLKYLEKFWIPTTSIADLDLSVFSCASG